MNPHHPRPSPWIARIITGVALGTVAVVTAAVALTSSPRSRRRQLQEEEVPPTECLPDSNTMQHAKR